MQPPRRILLTTDLSEESRRAFAPVGELARTSGATIHVLHVVPIVQQGLAAGAGYPFSLPDLDRDIADAQNAVESAARTLPEDCEVTTSVCTGSDVAKYIASEAKERSANWIAMSTHGRTGLRRLVLGSVAEGVLRHTEVPVLFFPPATEGRPPAGVPKHILFGTDFSPTSLRPLESVLSIAKEFDAKLTILHVVPELSVIPHGSPLAPPMPPHDLPQRMHQAREALDQMCEEAGGLQDVQRAVVAHENTGEAFAEHAKQEQVDWIAVATHGHGGLKRLVLGSVAGAILRHSPVPVLGFPR